jgi:Sulfotransferase domain
MVWKDAAVDFIYIGGPRCGSTWLSAVLDDHPSIFIPPSKEVHFFNDRMPYTFEYKYPLGIEYYKSYFADATQDQRRGDISPFTFLDPNAAWRIHQHAPDVKILCFLRDPVAMLHSLYLLLRQRERRASSFAEEIAQNPNLIDLCRYDRMLQPYYDHFSAEQIHVRVYEELYADRSQTMREIYEFIGVDPEFDPPSASWRFNAATDAAPKLLHRNRGLLVDALNRPVLRPVKHFLLRRGFKNVRRHGMTEDSGTVPARQGPEPEVRAILESLLQPDLDRLQQRLGRTLPAWRSVSSRVPAQERVPETSSLYQ